MQVTIKVHRQEVTLVLLILSCQLLISCGRPPGLTTCRGPVFVRLQSFDSAETGARAAVQRLSQEIHRCGEAEKYDIDWKWPSSEQERGWRALRYTRKTKRQDTSATNTTRVAVPVKRIGSTIALLTKWQKRAGR